MRNDWLDQGAPPGWRVAGDPRRMGQLQLVNDSENLVLRVLKERRRTYPGGVPVAGPNSARRAVWRQTPLAIDLPDEPILNEAIELLLLWDRASEPGGSVVTVRLVHTLAPGIYGKRVPLDLSYELTPGGGIFDNLRFGGDPQDDDLFASIDRQENEGDELAN